MEVLFPPRQPPSRNIAFMSAAPTEHLKRKESFVIDLMSKKCDQCCHLKMSETANVSKERHPNLVKQRGKTRVTDFEKNERHERKAAPTKNYNPRKVRRDPRKIRTRPRRSHEKIIHDDEQYRSHMENPIEKKSFCSIFISRTSQVKLTLPTKYEENGNFNITSDDTDKDLDHRTDYPKTIFKNEKYVCNRKGAQDGNYHTNAHLNNTNNRIGTRATQARTSNIQNNLDQFSVCRSIDSSSDESAPLLRLSEKTNNFVHGRIHERRRSFSPFEKIRASIRSIRSQIQNEIGDDQEQWPAQLELSEKSTQTEIVDAIQITCRRCQSRVIDEHSPFREQQPRSYDCHSVPSSVVPKDYPRQMLIEFTPNFSNNYKNTDKLNGSRQTPEEVDVIRDKLIHKKPKKKSLSRRLRKLFSREDMNASREMISTAACDRDTSQDDY